MAGSAHPRGNTLAQTFAGGENRLMISVAVMLATIMVILDMTVVNVNLSDMMGALGANSEQITWVLTSYIVAEAVVIPLGGVLASRYGRKRLMLASVAGFVTASALCGQAGTLTTMVFFRVLQGMFAASIVPMSQAIMVDTFPPEDRGRAMAIWGIGIMLGPILGPTLGGYISGHLSWRWVFYINVPVGMLNLLLLASFLRETKRRAAAADWIGAAFLIVGIGSLQAVLDQGNQRDWFSSELIVVLAMTSIAALAVFVWRSFGRDDPVLRLKLLADRNLATSSLMIMAFGLGMFGTIALQPIMLSRLFGYPPETIGLLMAPRGVAAAVGMFMVANLINRFDPRYLVSAGVFLSASGSWMMGWLTLDADAFWIMLPAVVQGLGLGMIFVPLSTLAYSTLPRKQTDYAAGIFNLSRTLGSSIGISIASTQLTHAIASARVNLSGYVSPANPDLLAWLQRSGMTVDSREGLAALQQILMQQAGMLGFVHTFVFIAISFVLLFPMVLLLRGGVGSRARIRRPH